MNKQERTKMVKAMEYIARQINDEEVLMPWLQLGVADGDIEYRDLDPPPSDVADYAEDYIEDRDFADLMDAFLWCMSKAYKSGGLYCDGIVSRPTTQPSN